MAAFGDRFGFKIEAHEKGDANRSARGEGPVYYIERNLYPGRNFLHIDIHDWTFGPPSRKYHVDTGTGWREIGQTDAARASW